MKTWLSRATLALLGAVVVAGALLAARRPSHDRDWIPEQARLAEVRITGDTVRVAQLRDFRHAPGRAPLETWTAGVYDLAALERVWFVLSPFSPRFDGLAHPFLSFEFADSQFVALSIEARKEIGENYSPLRGLLRSYESMVVLGTEADLLGLRAIAWDDPLYLFPIAVTRAQARELFVALLQRAQRVEAQPEWYNTIFNNCTTQLLEPINRMAERPVGRKVGLLPGYSFEAAYERGWIDTDLPMEQARAAHRVNDVVRASIDEADFSYHIRSGMRRLD